MKNFIQKRYFEEEKKEAPRFFDETRENKTLREYLSLYDKIIVLGNPGSGKTTELKSLFNILWEDKSKTNVVPIFIKINLFRKDTKFENLISFPDWRDLPNMVFLLDGLDEIPDIQDFISELQLFILRHRELNIKYVVSCRLNVYGKYIGNITNFKSLYLKQLNVNEIQNILDKKYGSKISDVSLLDGAHLSNPFFLDLLARYLSKHGSFPSNQTTLWEEFIKEITYSFLDKYKKFGQFDAYDIVKQLTRVALFSELTQRSSIEDIEMGNFINNEFIKIDKPFLSFDESNRTWSFLHKQIQEYLVAKILNDFDFDKIMTLIKIDGIDNVHPSMINSITFLLNLLDPKSPKFKLMVDWFLDNQVEILIKADSNRINDAIREKVFKDYFRDICIEKTLWISNQNGVSVNDLASFAECDGNFQYLIEILINKSAHRRARLSSLTILEKFKIPTNKVTEIKDIYLKILRDKDEEVQIKADLISVIENQFTNSEYSEFINQVFEIFNLDKRKIINTRLLSLLDKKENIDDYFKYLRAEFFRVNNITPRNDNDNVGRGNSYKLEQLILKLKSPENFIEIVKFYFNYEYKTQIDNRYFQQILEKCIEFDKLSDNFIISLLAEIKELDYLHSYRVSIKKLIDSSINKEKIIQYLIRTHSGNKKFYFISYIIEEKSLPYFLEELMRLNTEHIDIERTRNYISNINSRDIAEIFQDMALKKGVFFKEKLYTSDDIKQINEESIKRRAFNLEILLDKELLLKEIQEVFNSNNNDINTENIHDIEIKWYDRFGHGSILDSSITIIGEVLFSLGENSVTLENVENYLNNDTILFEKLKKRIRRHQSSNWDVPLDKEKQMVVYDWCVAKIDLINFDDILIYNNDGANGNSSFRYGKDYNLLDLVLFFREHFKFKFDKLFLLKSLPYIHLHEVNDDSSAVLVDIKNEINDDELFNEYIINHLRNNRNKTSINFLRFIDYAINNDLESSYEYIDEFFKYSSVVYIDKSRLELFSKKYNNPDILKGYCENLNHNLTWTSIEILSNSDNNKDFCIDIAHKYIETKEKNYLQNAISTLVKYNDEKVVEIIANSLKEKDLMSLSYLSFENFSYNGDLSKIEELYYLIYELYSKENRNSHYDRNFYRTFYEKLVSSLSKRENQHQEILGILHRIKDNLKDQKSDLFFINILIDLSNNVFINSRSRAYSFEEAKRIIIELMP